MAQLLALRHQTQKLVMKWHKAGEENGGITCEDPPGVREAGGMKAYLAYLKDPSGNKICTMINLK